MAIDDTPSEMEAKTDHEKKREREQMGTEDVALPSLKVQRLMDHQRPTKADSTSGMTADAKRSTNEPPLEFWLKEDGDRCNIPLPIPIKIYILTELSPPSTPTRRPCHSISTILSRVQDLDERRQQTQIQ